VIYLTSLAATGRLVADRLLRELVYDPLEYRHHLQELFPNGSILGVRGIIANFGAHLG